MAAEQGYADAQFNLRVIISKAKGPQRFLFKLVTYDPLESQKRGVDLLSPAGIDAAIRISATDPEACMQCFILFSPVAESCDAVRPCSSHMLRSGLVGRSPGLQRASGRLPTIPIDVRASPSCPVVGS